ncbi:base excision DNA repair protein [Drechmeria coniospora]|uniref:Base excision DNA repair protein n=1 Tax=Drechmeria coniospora TaxID=98403 RepID=A0A151GJ47_DRECN|nr:base excision DNA repair protein [Drechmeria coniospora]KYK57145.1 base excision DNA repair protein [Drechmeria coniospora]
MPVGATMHQPLRRSARHRGRDPVMVAVGETLAEVQPSTFPRGSIVKQISSPAIPPKPETGKIKTEPPDTIVDDGSAHGSVLDSKPSTLGTRKPKSFLANGRRSPFPDFTRPTSDECVVAHRILAALHGDRPRPDKVIASTVTAGCGASPSVLDALIRTILSQNTSDKNSSRAKQSMDAVYGGSDKWEAIVAGGQPKLQRAIHSGGLSVIKSKVIIGILQEVKVRHGVYSLDHLFRASDEDAMREMLSFQGVGPKTASCVLLFCLQRPSFAVDTHVHRIAGLLGWRPAAATREATQAHLDAVVPDEEKYPLHVLLVQHGKVCHECKAGGKKIGKCELSRAFGTGQLEHREGSLASTRG